MSKQHELKCVPHFFAAVKRGDKLFEMRRNDRDYKVGDSVILREFDPTYGHTGEFAGPFVVSYILDAELFPALPVDFIIMGLRLADEGETVIGRISEDPQVFPSLDKRCYAYREMAGEPYAKGTPCPVCVDGKCKYDV